MTSRQSPLAPAVLVALFLALPTVAATPALAQKVDPGPKSGSGSGDASDPRAPLSNTSGRLLVGDQAPDFDLRDADNKGFRLQRDRSRSPWLVIFARRPVDLVEVERSEPDLASLGVGVVVIAPFTRAKLTPFVPQPRLRLLHDRTSRTARIYGLFDPLTRNPRPGVILVDKTGRILLIVSGGIPSGGDLLRLTRQAMNIPEPIEELPRGTSGP